MEPKKAKNMLRFFYLIRKIIRGLLNIAYTEMQGNAEKKQAGLKNENVRKQTFSKKASRKKKMNGSLHL